MYNVAFQNCIDSPWTHMEPLVLGQVPGGRGTTGAFVVVEANDEPLLRVDLYSGSACFAFEDAIVWSGLLVIGWGERLYLVDLDTHASAVSELGGYFGHLYAAADYLLIASCDRLFRFAADRTMLWRSERLGIDGVIVDSVAEGVVRGQGEWDPPGGWIPFTLDLTTGADATP